MMAGICAPPPLTATSDDRSKDRTSGSDSRSTHIVVMQRQCVTRWRAISSAAVRRFHRVVMTMVEP